MKLHRSGGKPLLPKMMWHCAACGKATTQRFGMIWWPNHKSMHLKCLLDSERVW